MKINETTHNELHLRLLETVVCNTQELRDISGWPPLTIRVATSFEEAECCEWYEREKVRRDLINIFTKLYVDDIIKREAWKGWEAEEHCDSLSWDLSMGEIDKVVANLEKDLEKAQSNGRIALPYPKNGEVQANEMTAYDPKGPLNGRAMHNPDIIDGYHKDDHPLVQAEKLIREGRIYNNKHN